MFVRFRCFVFCLFFLIVSFSCVSVVLFVRFYLIEFLSLSISSLSLSLCLVCFVSFSFSLFACVFLMLCLLCLIVFVVFFVLFVRLVVCLLADLLFDFFLKFRLVVFPLFCLFVFI